VYQEFHAYLIRLRRNLQLDPGVEEEVLKEMRSHFEDRLADYRARGMSPEEAQRAVTSVFGRPQVLARRFYEAHCLGSWQDALLAAAPMVLVSAVFATHLWRNPLVDATLAAVVILTTLNAWWRGHPAWLYAWAGVALTVLVFCGYFAFVILGSSVGALAKWQSLPWSLLGVVGSIVFYPMAAALLVSCTAAVTRRDWMQASLMLSPLVPITVWIAAVHGSGGLLAPDMGRVAQYDASLAATFAAIAGVAALLIRVRGRTLRMGTFLITAFVLLLAVSVVYDPSFFLPTLLMRGLLLIVFLLSPAALEAVLNGALSDALHGRSFHDEHR
jgi:hypothetical protein